MTRRIVRAPWRSAAGVLVVVLTTGSAAPPIPAVQSGEGALPPPRFSDPDRAAKLRTAFADVDRIFREFTARIHAPGAAWGIIVDGRLAHAGTTGVRDTTAKSPVDADTVFRIASMTKSFTAMAILKLRDEGKLALDDPAERYVPELKGLAYPTQDSPRITIRHLLTHSEGFPEDNPWGDQQLAATEDEFSRMLRAGVPFSNAPGVAYEYSNLGFAILGRIVSAASGRPYRQYVSEAILKPLGMTSTTLDPAAVSPSRFAHGYRWEDQRWKEEPALPDGAFGAMGGMLTTVGDLSRYVAALLDAWPPRDAPEGPPLRRASLREMQQLHRYSGAAAAREPAPGTLTLNAGGYGYGLRIAQTCSFRHLVSHGGGLPGYGSLMQWLPEHGVGIVGMANVTYAGWSQPFGAALAALQKTGGLEPRVAQPSRALVEARDAVSRLVIRWDDRLADRIAAGNLFLDQSKARRRATIDVLQKTVGACTQMPTAFDSVENALRGQWYMYCERGRLRMSITLAPTMPPAVQAWTVRGGEFSRGGACTQ